MAPILRRTIYIEADQKNGTVYYRPHDWAMVLTTLGNMAEPFLMFQRIRQGNYPAEMTTPEFEAESMMVNDIQIISLDKATTVLGEGVTGGNQEPRIGR